jgi:hypothetical protein
LGSLRRLQFARNHPARQRRIAQRLLLVLAAAELSSRARLDPQLVVSPWQIDFPLETHNEWALAPTQTPPWQVLLVQHSAVAVQACPPRTQARQVPLVHRQPAQHELMPSPQGPPS